MEEYREQLRRQCARCNCMRIFCRSHHRADGKEQIAEILAGYGRIFLCENIGRLFCGNIRAMPRCPIIDLFFYVDALAYGSRSSRHAVRGFIYRKSKAQARAGSARTAGQACLGARPCQALQHGYCSATSEKLSHVDSYLLVGVVHLLLNSFVRRNNFNVGLIVIRLFVAVSRTAALDPAYYSILHEVYEFVCRKVMSSAVDIPLAEPSGCTHAQCLFQTRLSRQDFVGSVEAVCAALNASIITNIRESAKIHSLLEILRILYEINEAVGILGYEKFYLAGFCSRFNLRTEFKFYRTGYDTALNYSFILPVHIKAEILKMENSDAMKSSLQDAFFRSLFEGVMEPYLFITIRRKAVYRDTFEMVQQLGPEDLKKQLKVKFADEDGVDSGGIRKEYFQLLSQEIASDKTLFSLKNNRIWLKRGVCLEKMNKIGKLVGMALYNDVVLNIPFPFLIFKKILRRALDFDDLAEIEPEHYRSLLNLEKCSADELRSSELYFTVEDMEAGAPRIHELVPGGSKVLVTKENFAEFKRRYSEFYTEKLVEKEFSSFMEGFNEVIDPKSISLLQPGELEKIIIGLDEFDFAVIKATTTYNGYTKDARIIRDFWAIVEGYNYAYKKKLLQFITGNDRLPVAGSKALKLTIIRNGCDTERLPSSQTCFNTLLLPEYSTKEKLSRKLNKALKLAAGFFLI